MSEAGIENAFIAANRANTKNFKSQKGPIRKRIY